MMFLLSTLGLFHLLPGNGTGAAVEVVAVEEPAAPSTMELRVDVAELYSDDSASDRHLSYTDLRTVMNAERFAFESLSASVDVRARRGWNQDSDDRLDVTRAYLTVTPRPWFVSAGRLVIEPVAHTQVDGAEVGIDLSDAFVASAFGGLMPHPITGGIDPDFLNAGLGYRARFASVNHAGGLSTQLYQGRLDRLFLTERVTIRSGNVFSLYGQVLTDLASRSGVIGDLSGKGSSEQNIIERIDLTQAHLGLRLRPSSRIDFALSGSHHHSVLPNKWWEDWAEQERARLGFSLDGPLPVGTRRTNARLTTNVHFAFLSPYVVLRYDRRHEDARNGYEGKLGLKVDGRDLGYLDLSFAHRRHFEGDYQLGAVQAGMNITEGLNLDAGVAALRSRPFEAPEAAILYDINGTVWMDLGRIRESLAGLSVLSLYQAFVEPGLLFHVFMLQVGYRFRS